jgi:hypothetical protein
VQGVLSGIEQDATGTRHREAAQARRAGGNRDSQIQGEEGFAALGFPTNDSNGLLGPQSGDEPALLLGAIGETIGLLDR